MPGAAATRSPVPVVTYGARTVPAPFGWRTRLVALAISALPSVGFSATFTWTVGDFAPNVTAPSPLPSGDVLIITGNDTKRFLGGSFTNAGNVQWLAGSVQGANGATVLNAGIWASFADSALTGSSPLPVFTNTGTLQKRGGSGATTIGNWTFSNNAGTIDSQVGTILF